MRISDWSSDVCSSDLDGDDFLDLGDADLCRGRHRLVEVARGLAEDEVAALVGLPPLDDREVGEDAAFEDIIRSGERRGGKECVGTCKSRWSPYNQKKKNNIVI